MAAGLGVLGLAPTVFWTMTPREFDAALRGRLGGAREPAAPSRADLAALMRQFPDGMGET
ncbi:MAG: phage tail assembly chaperone [Hyphomicrobium sp.]|nr:phage tail assembly chaperone [Hyphomicrobium sp.]PPD07240.1 MAG: hypothetical protein CTY28_10730 [Hyphomicrobium sp.]